MTLFSFSGIGFIYILLCLVAFFMALLVAMPVHEFAHAFTAKKEGDYTAYYMKRCTLAPFAHVDLKGLIFLILFGFGWAKPVPVDQRNFKHGRKSAFLVSIAGILANLIAGTLFLFIYYLLLRFFPQVFEIQIYGFLLEAFLIYSYSLNFSLAFFNLLPIYPLDGFHVVESLSKTENGYIRFMKRNSLWIMLIFIITGVYLFYYEFTSGLVIDGLSRLFEIILGM